ncbi:MAG: hypothetical protein HONBIEJF_00192 [Fimbriimonadaceae bacterium]|nr:hypothetical protein [Fimbriimonadaceae bacterium]
MRKIYSCAFVAVMAVSSQAAVFRFATMLTSDQEVPPNGSPAFGSGAIEIDTVAMTAKGTMTAHNLVNGTGSVTDYHIHQAPFGVSGPVRVWINQASNIIDIAGNTWTSRFNLSLTRRSGSSGVLFDYDGDNNGGPDPDDIMTMVGLLQSGQMYMNLHTTFAPSGEIRGQMCEIVPEPASIAALSLGALALLRRKRR